MNVVSFNVFVGIGNRIAPVRERAVEFCRRLTDDDVDLLLLQEVWSPALVRFIGARLPSLPYAAWRPGLTGQPAGGLVVFSRRPLDRPSYVTFSGTSPRRGSPLFRGISALRSRIHGILTVKTTDGAMVVGNTQLTSNCDGDWSPSGRHYDLHRQQLRIVQDAMLRAGTAPLAILGGDFNVASNSPLYPLIVDHGAWRDPFTATDPPTYRAEYLPPGCPVHRIDYLLLAGDPDRFPVTKADLVLTEPGQLNHGTDFLSDHLAPRIHVGPVE
jgi:hypothetical protein